MSVRLVCLNDIIKESHHHHLTLTIDMSCQPVEEVDFLIIWTNIFDYSKYSSSTHLVDSKPSSFDISIYADVAEVGLKAILEEHVYETLTRQEVWVLNSSNQECLPHQELGITTTWEKSLDVEVVIECERSFSSSGFTKLLLL